jgi:hypothetical protein
MGWGGGAVSLRYTAYPGLPVILGAMIFSPYRARFFLEPPSVIMNGIYDVGVIYYDELTEQSLEEATSVSPGCNPGLGGLVINGFGEIIGRRLQ